MRFQQQTNIHTPIQVAETEPVCGLNTPSSFEYIAKPGDTLWKLATHYLRSGYRWREIYQLNQDSIGKDPNRLLPGQIINIPVRHTELPSDYSPLLEEEAGETAEISNAPYIVIAGGLEFDSGRFLLAIQIVQSIFDEWKQPFNPNLVFLTIDGGRVVIALQWESSWGPAPIHKEGRSDNYEDVLNTVCCLSIMRASEGWKHIGSDNQDRLLVLLGETDNPISRRARSFVQSILTAPDWNTSTPEVQAGKLIGFLSEKEILKPKDCSDVADKVISSRDSYITLYRASDSDTTPLEALGWSKRIDDNVFKTWQVSYDPSWVSIVYDADGLAVALQWQDVWGIKPQEDLIFSDICHILSVRLCLLKLQQSEGWSALYADEQDQLLALLGGETNSVSDRARKSARKVMTASDWNTLSSDIQAEMLSNFLDEKEARPFHLESKTAPPMTSDYSVIGPVTKQEHKFAGVTADAEVWGIFYPDSFKSIMIYLPQDSNLSITGELPTIGHITLALAQLEKPYRNLISSITVNPVRNPDDSYWAKKYEMPDFRSYMSAGAKGAITIYPTTKAKPISIIEQTFRHEVGHTWSMRLWGHDTEASTWNEWKDAMASDRISLTRYATASIHEDVAEHTSFYAESDEKLLKEYRAMVPARFRVLDKYLG